MKWGKGKIAPAALEPMHVVSGRLGYGAKLYKKIYSFRTLRSWGHIPLCSILLPHHVYVHTPNLMNIILFPLFHCSVHLYHTLWCVWFVVNI